MPMRIIYVIISWTMVLHRKGEMANAVASPTWCPVVEEFGLGNGHGSGHGKGGFGSPLCRRGVLLSNCESHPLGVRRPCGGFLGRQRTEMETKSKIPVVPKDLDFPWENTNSKSLF